MMKNKNLIWLGLCSFLLCNPLLAQISGKYYGEKEDFKKMAKRTLIVEILEEDADVIKNLSKKEKRAKQLEEYKNFIKHYNEMIRAAVPKYWTYNATIEYKTTTQIEDLQKSKSNKFVLLSYFELGDSDLDYIERSDLVVPALRYTRIEEPNRKPDYKIYLPSSFIRAGKRYLEADFKVALEGMQNNIKYNIKNDKTPQFQDYTEEVSEKNCSRLKNLTLLLEKKQLYEKVTEQEAQAAFGAKIEWVGESDIEKHVVGKTKGMAAMFSIPYALAKGGVGPISTSTLGFFKIVIDCETGDILWSNNPGNMPIGKNIGYFLIEKEIKNMAQCKL
jgi:hypothetical protein